MCKTEMRRGAPFVVSLLFCPSLKLSFFLSLYSLSFAFHILSFSSTWTISNLATIHFVTLLLFLLFFSNHNCPSNNILTIINTNIFLVFFTLLSRLLFYKA